MALGPEAAAGDLMVVEDGPAPRARREGEGRGDSVLAAFAAGLHLDEVAIAAVGSFE